MATKRATSMSLSSMDESRYRNEVLRLEEAETEDNLEEQLVAEASELGLKIPDIQIAASLAATINAGILDFTIPAPSSASSSSAGLTRNRPSFTHPRSFADLVRSSVASVDQLASSLSETTVSDRDHSGRLPSIDSLSTRPTSISSCDVKIIPPHSAPHERPSWAQSPQQVCSPKSPASTSASSSLLGFSDRKRSSFINAIGRPFRKRRTPSSVNLPPNAHISLKKNEGGGANTVIVETEPVKIVENARPGESQGHGTLQVEVPVFDEAAIKRTKEDTQLKALLEKHKAERSRFLQLRTELLDSLKEAHLTVVAEKRLSNDKAQKTKKEWNTDFLARMEERQLSVEIDQIKEFERSKRNSQTRIKYMEGYVNTSSPPQSPHLSGSESGFFEPNSNGTQQQTLRTVTRRQKEQLAQEYLDRDSMDRLHEARIKVLRERQEQQLQETTARLEKELETLISKNAEAIVELERDHQRAEQKLIQAFETKKNRLRRRWNIEEAILRKRLEDQCGLPYGPLPNISFSVPDDDDDNVDGDHHTNNDREVLEFEIPISKDPFASATKES